ncbi:MAG: TIGR03619 family F420-dependent LLM class oxidoreductase [Candidatus Dormibacteraeota bacterium]|nr:TIGR03619 family F420-dependent LLM class oxidoreductase [Candidatus Dormibacteraeota bacterium]
MDVAGPLKIGVKLPEAIQDVGEWLADAAAFEAAGADSLWLSERLLRPPEDDAGPPPTPEPWTLMAAVAAATHHARLGTSVSVAALWPPALLAGVVTTLDLLSGGRVIVGAGAGWEPVQFSAVGLDFATRGRRLDELISALRHLWSNPNEPYSGELYDLPALRLAEGVRPGGPPIFVGALSEPGYLRAARLAEGFIHAGGGPRQVAELFDHIRKLRKEAGRARDPFELWVQVPSPGDRADWARTLAAYAETGATGVLVSAGPRLLDMLRNPDQEIDRSDLFLAQG